jgi:hypothetical protein
MKSVPPDGVAGTMMRIGLVGYVWATAAPAITIVAARAVQTRIQLRRSELAFKRSSSILHTARMTRRCSAVPALSCILFFRLYHAGFHYPRLGRAYARIHS